MLNVIEEHKRKAKQYVECCGTNKAMDKAAAQSIKLTKKHVTNTWTLGISKKKFKRIYGDKINPALFTQTPKTDVDLLKNFLPSKLWRLNNLYNIVDKKGNRIVFKMNPAQHKVYAASLEHPRLIILKSRQQGISTFWLISYLDDGLVNTNLSIGLMAQGREESETLLKRVKTALDYFPIAIWEFLDLAIIRDNTGEIAFTNGSTIFIRTSFRSATLHRLHISEYGKICHKTPERALETKTGTLQTIQVGNIVVIESTAEGFNDFKIMWDTSIITQEKVRRTKQWPGKAFKPIFLSWLDDPDCESSVYEQPTEKQSLYFEKVETIVGYEITIEQRNFWIDQYNELKDKIYQEYPATPEEAFTKLNEGSYYGPLYLKKVVKQGRLLPNLYDPNLEVNVAMDLGISESDVMTLGFFQRFYAEWRVIHEYTNYGEGLAHYVDYIKETKYKINWVICPHDIKVRELGTGVSRLTVLRNLGVKLIKVLPATSVADGIEAVRHIIPDLWVDESCEYVQNCLLNYTKEWKEKTNTWSTKPLHNEWSHGADMLRYMAVSQVKKKVKEDNVCGRRNHNTVVDGLAL